MEGVHFLRFFYLVPPSVSPYPTPHAKCRNKFAVKDADGTLSVQNTYRPSALQRLKKKEEWLEQEGVGEEWERRTSL